MIALSQVVKLGLDNRDGEIMVGRDGDGICYLIAEAQTLHNTGVFAGLGGVEYLVITPEAFDALAGKTGMGFIKPPNWQLPSSSDLRRAGGARIMDTPSGMTVAQLRAWLATVPDQCPRTGDDAEVFVSSGRGLTSMVVEACRMNGDSGYIGPLGPEFSAPAENHKPDPVDELKYHAQAVRCSTPNAPSCQTCGSSTVTIRGRYPQDHRREVCQTCLAERMDTIREVADRDYGRAYQVRPAIGGSPSP